MKLENMKPVVMDRWNNCFHQKSIKEMCTSAKVNHLYTRDYGTYVGMGLIRAMFTLDEICEWYREYNCTDSHIVSLGKWFAREIGVL